jgi:hypothetical protein
MTVIYIPSVSPDLLQQLPVAQDGACPLLLLLRLLLGQLRCLPLSQQQLGFQAALGFQSLL